MASIPFTSSSSFTRRTLITVTDFPALSASSVRFSAGTARSLSFNRALKFTIPDVVGRGDYARCSFNPKDDSRGKYPAKEGGQEWAILKRWDVPWEWQTISLTSLACGLRYLVVWSWVWLIFFLGSFAVTGLVEIAALPYLGINITELSLDEKAELLFVDQSFTTAVILGIIYTVCKSYPLSDDFFRYDFREPFNLQKGWLLWAGIGLIGALIGIGLTGIAMSTFGGEAPQRETDALVRLLPLIGSSSISTISLLGVTGVLAPLLEETVFRGFFLVAMTKWVPTPVAVLISAAVFALAHLTPGQFPQLFVLGVALGFSYAHTRNLMTSITIHALWNSGVILFLTFLQLQGYDIRELLQAAS